MWSAQSTFHSSAGNFAAGTINNDLATEMEHATGLERCLSQTLQPSLIDTAVALLSEPEM